jgi:diguanylate cyclase (GGDEF)-like protein
VTVAHKPKLTGRQILAMAAALVFTALVGLADYFTAEELSFSLFYLFGVLWVTWFVGRGPGYRAALLVVALEYSLDLFAGRATLHPAIPIWNSVLRLMFFGGVVYLLSALKAARLEEQRLARTDPLTGAANYRAFREAAERELSRARRYARPLAMAYIDVDNFKEVNDLFGHQTGDEVLRALAGRLQLGLRATDLLARVGGDEFVLLLPETDEAQARQALERLQQELRDHLQRQGWQATLSLGLAVFLTPPQGVDAMLTAADRLMYEAKNGGKDRIQTATF